MRALLDANKHDVALFVGNGINRYQAPSDANSWEALLTRLARVYIDPAHECIPFGVSPTEFYDMLELKAGPASGSTSLQSQFCQDMGNWLVLPQHKQVITWAQRWGVPVLTTNFDETLSKAISGVKSPKRRQCGSGKFTAFYPWSTYYSTSDIVDPASAFGIWHVNGLEAYRQSIRLGLSHYMGSVARARGWLHTSGTRLYGASDIRLGPGANSWLHAFFHKPILFFGIGLGENEVFLRWLLIERARYFSRYPSRAKPGWYVHTKGSSDMNVGKTLFLKGVGIDPFEVQGHHVIYGSGTWA